MTIKRTFWKQVNSPLVYLASTRKTVKPGSGSGMTIARLVHCKKSEAQLIGSLTSNGLHAPVLDIDFPASINALSGKRTMITLAKPPNGFPIFLRRSLVNCGFVFPSEAERSVKLTEMNTTLITLNVPAKLVPSKTDNHHHLYIDHETTWEQFYDLLFSLEKIGFIDDDFFQMCSHSEQSFVRVPKTFKRGSV